LVKDAGFALNNIVKSVTETVADSDRILDITKSEVATSEQIVSLIESIAEINDSNAANAEPSLEDAFITLVERDDAASAEAAGTGRAAA